MCAGQKLTKTSKNCIDVSVQLRHEVGTLEMDMTKRSLVLGGSTSKPPNIDLYVAGYPGPSFSALGRKRGGLDARGVVSLSKEV